MSKAYADCMADNGEVPIAYSAANPNRLEVLADTDGPSMCRQEFAEECDINKIMARYEKTGQLPANLQSREPVYLDYTAIPDNLQEALRVMMTAEDQFMSLPAIVRKEFDNDPLRFVEYAENGDNLERMREWGLAPPEKIPDPPQRVEVVNPQSDNRSSEAPAAAG